MVVVADTSGQTLRTMSPAIISLAVVVPTCIIVGLVIAGMQFCSL